MKSSLKNWFIQSWILFCLPYKMLYECVTKYIQFERVLNKISKIYPRPRRGYSKLHLLPIEFYQDNFRFYEDEYQSNEPKIETDNFFYLRFLKRK